MGDSPFDLSKFDPSTLDLSHLHPAEQGRIKKRQFNTQELTLLLSRQNPWTKSGKPKPLPTTEPPPNSPTQDKDILKATRPLENVRWDLAKVFENEEKRRPQTQRDLEEFTRRMGFTPTPALVPPTKRKSWIHRIPVWKEFGHWLKWASASFAFTLAMVGAGEHLVAEIALVVAILCCLIQIWVWQKEMKSRLWSSLVKAALVLLTVILGGFAMLDVFYIKGSNDWTHLRMPSRAARNATSATQNPTPLPSTPSARDSFSPTPTPLPSASKSVKKRSQEARKKKPCSWENTLLGKC